LFEIEQKQEEGVKRKRVERLKKVVSNKKSEILTERRGLFTLSKITLSKNTLSKITLSKITLSKITLSKAKR
jgi:hypothetical protein